MRHNRIWGNSCFKVSKILQFIVSKDKDNGLDLDRSLTSVLHHPDLFVERVIYDYLKSVKTIFRDNL